MAYGKRSETWNFWSAHLSLTANCHRDGKKTKPFQPTDFHPDTAAKAAANKKQGVGDFLIAMKAMCRKNRFARR